MTYKAITRPFILKAHSDDGTFTGYGSVFHVEDSYREVVLPGAFQASIEKHREKGTAPAMLWQHRPDKPIGVWDEIKEDEHGLLMKGRILTDQKVPNADGAHALIKEGAIRGLSIGYSIPKGGMDFDEEKNITELSKINLWETSLVTFPANPEAFVTEVRSALESGIFPGVRDFTDWLMRDAGFSKEDAIHITRYGYKSLLMRDAESITHLTDILRRLTS
jgi:HK97 family phage prohead protease